MATATPDVALVEPIGWSETADVAPPKITTSATLTSFHASVSPGGETVLLRGCVASSIPGWVEDMRPAVEARTIALVGAATEKATGLPMDARREGEAFALRPAARLDGARIGIGRPFVGFDDGRVLTCFASCVTRTRSEGDRSAPPLACESAVLGAHLSPDLPPPPPGMLLGAVTWAVHHPRSFAEGAGLVVGAAILLALLHRPRASRRRSSRSFRAR